MKKTISEVLLRRNELKRQTDLRAALEAQAIFEPRVQRRLISEVSGMEQVDASIPKTTKVAVERERDYYSHQWRLCDGAVQQANHTTKIGVLKSVMKDFVSDETDAFDTEVEETLASLLTRRKGLEQKVTETIRAVDLALFVEKVSTRLKITDSLDTVMKTVEVLPAYKLLAKQIWYLRQLRLCETAIQKTNSTVLIDVPESVFVDFV